MKVKHKLVHKEVKCPLCRWKTDALYYIVGDPIAGLGLCGNCFADWIVFKGYEIGKVEP